jgi:SET domain-containing protein
MIILTSHLYTHTLIEKIRSNLRDDDWINPKAELRKSSIRGAGLFAKESLKQGELVLVWGCSYANHEEAEKAIHTGVFVMQWDEDLFTIDDGRKTSGYIINHSCDPNLSMTGPYALVTLRDVQPSEELRPDYAVGG